MSDSSFISIRGTQLAALLRDPKQDPDEVVLVEKGKNVTAAVLLRAVEGMPKQTMYHIPRPRP